MRITINRCGKPSQKLWDNNYSCCLMKKIFGFYIIGYTKNKEENPKGLGISGQGRDK